MRILLVEDDPMIGAAMHAALREAGHATDWVTDAKLARASLCDPCYDMLLLDLGLPSQDGLTLLRSLRAQQNTIPVVIVTARDNLADRIAGLDAGADDYLLKPFDLPELLARMRAVMRRNGGVAMPVFDNGVLSLNPANREVVVKGQAGVVLSNREFALLHALMLRPGAILSRRELEDRIYGWGEEVESNAVEYLIHALRKKLGQAVIRNIRGVGWMVVKAG